MRTARRVLGITATGALTLAAAGQEQTVTTLAAGAPLDGPDGAAVDRAGSVYAAS